MASGAPATSDDYDEDGLREVGGEAAREIAARKRREEKERERQCEQAKQEARSARRTELLHTLNSGELDMAVFAREAREAGMAVSDVAAALQKAQAERVSRIDLGAVARGDSDAVAASLVPPGSGAQESTHGERATTEKATGVELLRKGDARGAAQCFERGAKLAMMASATAAEKDATADATKATVENLSSQLSKNDADKLVVSCLLNEALCRVKLEEWDAVEAACSNVLSREPRSAKALYRRGRARLAMRNTDGALADLEQALAEAPGDKEIVSAVAAARAAATSGGAATSDAAAEGAGAGVDAEGKETAPSAAGVGGVLSKELSREPDPSRRSYVFMEFSVDGKAAGRVSLELFDDLAPRTAANFRALCAGFVNEGGDTITYADTAVHRVVKGFVVQGGDILHGDGSGSVSIHGSCFDDERLDLPHGSPGVLSMANMGPNTNGCQWFITLNPAPSLDGRHVAFGRVLDGMSTVRALAEVEVDAATEKPVEAVRVSACGVLSEAEAMEGLQREARANAAAQGGLAHDDVVGGGGGGGSGAPRPERQALELGGEALTLAAARGDVQMARTLVTNGIPIDAYGNIDDAALGDVHTALGGGDGASVRRSALQVAARRGDEVMVKALLAAGADPRLEDSQGRCALHLAAMADSGACVKSLLESKADACQASDDGKAAVHLAVARGAADALSAILAADRSQASNRHSALLPLHLSAAGNHASCAAVLIASAAPLDALAASDHSALHLAAAAGAIATLQLLLAARASVDVVGERSGKTPLHCACERGSAAATAHLLAAKASVTAVDANGSTALHWACLGGVPEVVRLLIDARASATAISKRGSTPLHLACQAGSLPCVQRLLEANALATSSDMHGVMALHAASAVGSADCVDALLGAGAPVGAELRITGKHQLSQDAETTSKTPLYLAAEKGHAAAVATLVNHGADVHAPASVSVSGVTSRTSALWAAKRGGHDLVAEILEAAGAVERADTVAGP